jgi:hypothetical protein
MMLATATVIWIHLLAAARMMRSVKTRVALRVVISAAVVVLAAQGWIIGDAIARPYDLYRADLAGAFLPKANLRGAYAARANFEGAILIEADLTGADLGNAKMAGADLTAARLTDADVHWTDLRRANLSMADLSRSDFLHADLRDANLVSANLSDTTISGVDWEGAVLDSASLDRARIENSNFRNASLLNASLKDVKDNGAYLRGYSLGAAKGVTLSAEQRSQLDISVEPKPIYDRTGQTIGQDVERTFSTEALDRFFAPVEAGLTPSQHAASLPSPADASQASDASPVSRPSPTSWSTWQGGNDSTEPPAYSERIATIGSMDAARRAGGIPASDATSTATATASR